MLRAEKDPYVIGNIGLAFIDVKQPLAAVALMLPFVGHRSAFVRKGVVAQKRGSTRAENALAVHYCWRNQWALATKWWLINGKNPIELALCFLLGKGVKVDSAGARKLLANVIERKIAVSGIEEEEAMAMLAVMAANGIGMRRDFVKAKQLLGRANGDSDYPETACVLVMLDEHRPTSLYVARSPLKRHLSS